MTGTTHRPAPHAGPPRVVVVDDDGDMRAMLDVALREAGYHPLLVAHEADAVPTIQQAQPALIILDLWMEHINSGVQILHTLHADPTTRAISVIVASAHPFLRPELADLLREPHYVFVEKPFPLEDLLSSIATVLAPPADAPTSPAPPTRP